MNLESSPVEWILRAGKFSAQSPFAIRCNGSSNLRSGFGLWARWIAMTTFSCFNLGHSNLPLDCFLQINWSTFRVFDNYRCFWSDSQSTRNRLIKKSFHLSRTVRLSICEFPILPVLNPSFSALISEKIRNPKVKILIITKMYNVL